MVPPTCALSGTCIPAISTETSAGQNDNGLVAGSPISNNSGCAMGSVCFYSTPNGGYKSANTLSSADKYSYQTLYDLYFVSQGAGTTLAGGSNMSDVVSAGGVGVFFIKGNFNVNVDNAVGLGSYLMVIADGSITFDQTVANSAGIFVADNGITASGSSASQLLIQGLLYSPSSGGTIKLSRGFTDKTDNNTKPAVLVKYRSDFIFNMPPIID
jgi:hypothetical protein